MPRSPKSRYEARFVSGSADPQALVGDASRPLVFYAVDSTATLRLAKTRFAQVRAEF